MKAYLEGDFDQAILLDTRAIQADVKNQKASDLLAVLVKEKEQNKNTEIWIGADRAAAQAPVVSSDITIPKPMPVSRTARHRSKKKLKPATPVTVVDQSADNKALEGRVETLLLLMGRNASDQYRELTTAQVDTVKRVDENLSRIKTLQADVSRTMEESDSQLMLFTVFQCLALIAALLALWMAYRARVEIKRLRSTLQSNHRLGEERGNILPLDGTFR
jgi:hypothetical protein